MASIKCPLDRINRHLSLLGYAGSDLHKLILKWQRSSGNDFVVERLKTLKQQFILILADQDFDKAWVKYTKSGLPSGPFGQLFRLGFKKPKLCISVLNTYLCFNSPSVDKQKKAILNISRPMTDKQAQFVKQMSKYVSFGRDSTYHFQKAFSRVAKPDKDMLTVNAGLNTAKPFVGHECPNQWLNSMKYTSRRILPTESISCHFVTKGTLKVERFGGVLAILPERGNKARVIAVPHAELQVYLKPLHDTLGKCLQSLPEDCTFDQIKGARFARDMLKAGKTVHSVDLSAATDRFPLDLQISLLRKLNPDPGAINWASVFERTSRLYWRLPPGDLPEQDVRYGAGQPMGLYGSFNLFALTHHAILHTLIRALKLKSRPYRILGDDIVIAHDELARYYKSFMRKIGVEVSPTKTITSNKVAEFAGFIITKKQTIKAAKPPLDGLNVDSMVNYIKTLGTNPFGGSLKDLGDLLKYLPEPEGAGLNPRGLSQIERREFYFSGNRDDKKVVRTSPNIDNQASAFAREPKFWNSYTKSHDSSIPADKCGEDPNLKLVRDLTDSTRAELMSERKIGDTQLARQDLINEDKQTDLAYRGALGSHHRVVKRPQDMKKAIADFKKRYGFYPWESTVD